MRTLQHSLGDRRGAAIIEVALLAPLMFAFLFGILEVGRMMAVQAMVEHGVRLASRSGITGHTPPGYASREAYIRTVLLDGTAGLVDPDRLEVALLSYASFDVVGKPEPFIDKNGNGRWDNGESFTDVNGNGGWDADRGAAGVGAASEVVLYRVTYRDQPVTRLMAELLGDDTFIYQGRIVVRNEPFSDN